MKKSLFYGLLIGVVSFAWLVSGTLAMTGMGPATGKPTAEEQAAFKKLWAGLYQSAGFTANQTKQLAQVLNESSMKLAENYQAIDRLGTIQNGMHVGKDPASQKRLDLKEAERDVLVDQVKLTLEEFLNQDQVSLVICGAFNGVSMENSGADFQTKLHSGMNQMKNLEQQVMELGTLATKFNQNCQATTLEFVREFLKGQPSAKQ